MLKDSKRFADSGGWGYGVFEYDAPSDTFTPATLKDKPPQRNDAKCGFACHTAVKTKDYVFTDYGTGEAQTIRIAMTQMHGVAILRPLAVGLVTVLCTIFIHALAIGATVNFFRYERKSGRPGTDLFVDLPFSC
jgi:hypothetical protein